MSDDLGKKIKQFADILGQDNMSENLLGLLSLLTSSGGKDKDEQPEKASEKAPEQNYQYTQDVQSTQNVQNVQSYQRQERPPRNDFNDNFEIIRKAKNVMDRIKHNDDPRINLLNALAPFMNSHRKKKLGNCVRMLHMSNLSTYLDDNSK